MIAVRKAEEKDMKQVIQLVFDDDFIRQRETLQEDIPEEYVAAYREIINDPHNMFLIACIGEEVVAVSQIILSRHLARGGSLRATFEAVRVKKELRGQGIGTLLMKAAIETAKEEGCSLIQLTSRKERTQAHHFYEKLGFQSSHIGMKKVLDCSENIYKK